MVRVICCLSDVFSLLCSFFINFFCLACVAFFGVAGWDNAPVHTAKGVARMLKDEASVGLEGRLAVGKVGSRQPAA